MREKILKQHGGFSSPKVLPLSAFPLGYAHEQHTPSRLCTQWRVLKHILLSGLSFTVRVLLLGCCQPRQLPQDHFPFK